MALQAELTAAPTEDAVDLVFTVSNDGSEDVDLTFSDACQADFSALDPAGEKVWRWSDGQMFAQMLTDATIPAGGSVTFTQRWEDPDAGEWELVAELCAREVDVEARTTVTV